jgi:putative ABC transport system permease protein
MKKHPLTDLDREIADHIEREADENMMRGMAADAAHRAARRRFGNATRTVEAARRVWVPAWIDQLRQDLRYGGRMLLRNPGVATVAIVTLAMGIGLTTAVFSVVHAVLIRPLPYMDGDRLVVVSETFRQVGNASAGHFHDWTAHSSVFEHTAAGVGATFNLGGDGEPERVRGARVTPGYFRAAYLPPAIGRYFTEQDAERDPRLVVLSHSLWRTRFNSDPSIVGRRVRLGAESFTIVGVAPDLYALTDPALQATGGFSSQLWTPLVFTPEQRANFGSHYLNVLAKLKPDVTLARAQEDLERVTQGIAERHPQEMEGRGVLVQRLAEQMVGDAAAQLFVLFAAVGMVLLIGCVNVASVLAARATARRREIAIRSSLGGGQRRIVRQLLTESLVLAGIGGAASLLVAVVVTDFLVANGPISLPRLREAGLRLEVLLFALALTGVAAIISGLAPALHAAPTDLQGALRDGAKTALAGGKGERLRTLLVVAETAITVVLLIGTGLLLRSADKLRQVPFGFDPHNVVAARLSLPAARYASDAAVVDAYRRILEPLRSTKGVALAAAASHLPLSGNNADATTIAEGKTFAPGTEPSPMVRLVTDQYFEAVGMTIVSGRTIQAGDVSAASPPVVVINERLGSALWPGEDAVGKRLSTWSARDNPEWREVVGVVRDARTLGQSAPVPMELFLPYTHAPAGAWNAYQRSMAIVVSPNENWPESYVPQVRAALREVDPTIPLYEVRTLESVVLAATANRRFYMRLVLVLAVTGLGLAMLGVYGVISFIVAQRTPEIGLRLAIGAERVAVVRMVLSQAVRLGAVGLMIGVPGALAFTGVLRTLLFEIEPTDPLTFVLAGSVLLVTILTASLLPSLRAARVDPLVALRHE